MTVNNTADTSTNDNQGQGVSKEQALAGWGEPQEFIEPKSTQEGAKPPLEGRIPHRAELEAEDQGDGKGTEEKEDNQDDTTLEVEDEDDTPEVLAVEDPGTFTPGDYSFEVTYFEDEEGKKPRTVKITSVEQAEQLLDKDPNFARAKDLLDFNRKVTKMETAIERDKAAWQAKKDEFDTQAKDTETRQKSIENLGREINYLVSKGKLPSVDAKFANADWSKPEVAAQPGVKEQLALIAYMAKENKARAKAGLAPFSSAIDAFNAMQLDEGVIKRTQAEKAAGEARKAAGARVAGVSPAPISAAPKGIAVGRVSGRGLQGLGNDWGV
jgi:hypothetical protein